MNLATILDKVLPVAIWPTMVLIVAIIFMLIFKKPISQTIKNIKRAGRYGIETHEPQELDKHEAQVSLDPKKGAEEDLSRFLDSEVVRKREEIIREDLEKRGPSADADRNEILVRYLAKTQLSLEFERIFSQIYCSQVLILETLNTALHGETADALQIAYDDAVQRNQRLAEYPYLQYLGFLVSLGLMYQEGDRYLITPYGREFLIYMTAVGKSKYACPN